MKLKLYQIKKLLLLIMKKIANIEATGKLPIVGLTSHS